MLSKIIKYKKEAKNSGKNPDSIDSFILWMDEQKIKLEGDQEQIKKTVSTDLEKLIAMDDNTFSDLLQINPHTSETLLLMIEAEKEEIVKASTFDDFFMIINDSGEDE